MEIEPEMLAMETIVPVYFAVEDEELLSIYEQTRAASASQGSASAAEGEFKQGGKSFEEDRPVPTSGRSLQCHLHHEQVLSPLCLFCHCQSV